MQEYVQRHTVEITGLEPDTLYQHRAESCNAVGCDQIDSTVRTLQETSGRGKPPGDIQQFP